MIKFNKKIISHKKLYKASFDGFSAQDFHNKCDGKNFTVTIIMSKTGRIFGGFTEISWDKSSGFKNGENSFLFSLDMKEIYYYNNNYKSHSIYCSSINGPDFGFYDLTISNNCNKNYLSQSSLLYYDSKGRNILLAGSRYFSVLDYIVFQIEIA